MGLHICYELRLPQTTPDDHAIRRLERLRSYVEKLSVDTVSELTQLRGTDLLRDHDDFDRWSVPWLVHVTASGVREERDGTAGAITKVDRLATAAFLMHPRARLRVSAVWARPALALHPDGRRAAERAEEANNWYWHYCCKTQYASIVSDEHLVRCHLAVVATLEEAQRLGFGVTVH